MKRKTLNAFKLLVLLACMAAWPVHAVIQTNGIVDQVVIETNGLNDHVSFHFHLVPEGVVEVSPYAPDVARVRFHWDSLWAKEEVAVAVPLTNWPALSVDHAESSTNFIIETDELIIEVVKNPFRIVFRSPDGFDLLRGRRMEYDTAYHAKDDTTYDPGGGGSSVQSLPQGFKLKAIMEMPEQEAYFGFGEYPAPLNRRGHNIQCWNQDTYSWGEFRNPMYMSLPFFYGVQGPAESRPAFAYGVFFNNPTRPTFRMGTQFSDAYSFEAGDGQLDYFFFGGGADHDMKRVLSRYTELTGQPAMLPKWAFGYHQSKHSYDTQNRVHNLAEAFVQNDVPCDAIYLDIGTQNESFQMTFNNNFTNVAQMIDYCLDRGIRLIPLIEPCLKTTDPLYGEADGAGYFLKNIFQDTYVGGNFLGSISWIDFSFTPARAWWHGKMTNYLASYPFAGIWNDLNEPNENNMPLDVIFELDGRYGGSTNVADSRNWLQVNRNPFSVMECSLTYEAMKTAFPDHRPFVLSRAAWPGIQRYALGWSGDNVSSDDHLRHNTPLGVSVMISGQVNFGHDVGGFVGHPTPERMTRWIQAGSLNPFYRNHTFQSEAREPFEFNTPYRDIMRETIKFRYRLMPYLYTLAYVSHATGIPMNTPTVFHFTADTNTYAVNDYEFMVGDYLLAAPVYNSVDSDRWVYLPDGADWYHFAYDEKLSGGQWVNVPASLQTLPLFMRAGAIIPMGPSMQFVYDFVPDYLDIHVWPEGTTEFTLYEDDGLTTNYLAGDYAMTRFVSAASGGSLTFTIEERDGAYDPGTRDYFVVVHDAARVQSLLVNGNPVPRVAPADIRDIGLASWSYDYVKRHLTVRVPDSGGEQVVQVQYGSDPVAPGPFATSYDHMAVPGTFNNWDPGGRHMTLVSNHLWAAVIEINGRSEIEFKFAADDNWSVNWGEDAPAGTTLPVAGNGDSFGANILATGLSDGLYTFTFNEQTLAYSLTAADAVDTDGDGIPDGWEARHGFNPMNAADADWDEDGSGASNYAQYIAGTDPFDPESVLLVDGQGAEPFNEFSLSWYAVAGRTYDILVNTNELPDAAWNPVPGLTNLTGDGWTTATDTNVFDDMRRDYRIQVQLE